MSTIIQALDFTWLLASLAALFFVIHSIRMSYLSSYDEKLLELRIRLLKLRNQDEIDESTYCQTLEKLMTLHPAEVIGNRAKIYSGVVWCLPVLLSNRDSEERAAMEAEPEAEVEEIGPAELQAVINEGGLVKCIGFLIMVPIPTLLFLGWLASIFLTAYARRRPVNLSNIWDAISRVLEGKGAPIPQH